MRSPTRPAERQPRYCGCGAQWAWASAWQGGRRGSRRDRGVHAVVGAERVADGLVQADQVPPVLEQLGHPRRGDVELQPEQLGGGVVHRAPQENLAGLDF